MTKTKELAKMLYDENTRLNHEVCEIINRQNQDVFKLLNYHHDRLRLLINEIYDLGDKK